MRVASSTSPEEKLHLLEFLLASDDPGECGQRAAEWLAAHAGARFVVCAMIDAAGTLLIEIARHGLPRRGGGISVDLDQRDHRLVSVLWRTQPVVLSDDGGDDSLDLP